MKCLKCGNSEGYYCEECHQKLIAENLRLQIKLKHKETTLKEIENVLELILGRIKEELK